MKTYDYGGSDLGPIRVHPWTTTMGDPAGRYLDLKKNPALIRSALEDFLPWSGWPAIETFYLLLEWLNGSDSTLESNDCAFERPAANTTVDRPKALEVSGRLMVLWRDLPLNLLRSNIEWLRGGIHRFLNERDDDFIDGAIGITICPTKFITLPVTGENNGFQLMLSFWSWGDTDDEVMTNLDRTLHNLDEALRGIVKEAEE